MSFRCAEKSQVRHSIMMKIKRRPYGVDKNHFFIEKTTNYNDLYIESIKKILLSQNQIFFCINIL